MNYHYHFKNYTLPLLHVNSLATKQTFHSGQQGSGARSARDRVRIDPPWRIDGRCVDRLGLVAVAPRCRLQENQILAPIVDSALRWHPRIHVSGPLAELELGPASRNIAGARLAGTRLVEAARARG